MKKVTFKHGSRRNEGHYRHENEEQVMEKMSYHGLQRNQWHNRRRDDFRTHIWIKNGSFTVNYKKEERGFWKRRDALSYFFIHVRNGCNHRHTQLH